MTRIILLFILILTIAPDAMAHRKMTIGKRLKEARAAIKSASGQENIERILLDSIALPTTTDNIKAEGYHYCALLEQSMNDGLNMNAYLKQNIDTARFYRTILNIYNYTQKSDSLDAKGAFKAKNTKLRAQHRENLLGGGKYHLRSSRWVEAYPFFDAFLRTRAKDMDDVVGRVAYWATVCGMNENNPHHVLRYVDTAIALLPEEERPALLEYKARSCVSLCDSVMWVDILKEGVNKYPRHNYFFLNLMDYYMRHGQIERGMEITDSLVRHDGDRAVYWFAMSMFALSDEDYEKCIRMSDECLSREPDNADAHYNKGISLLNMALNEKDVSRRQVLYRRALEPMECVRKLLPEDVQKWGNPLYRIYFNLNMGSKFEEIDSILNRHPEVKRVEQESVNASAPRHSIDTGVARKNRRWTY